MDRHLDLRLLRRNLPGEEGFSQGQSHMMSRDGSFNAIKLVDISDDGFLSLMEGNGDVRDDIKVPDSDVGKEIKDKFEKGDEVLVTILKAMGEELAISCKNAPK